MAKKIKQSHSFMFQKNKKNIREYKTPIKNGCAHDKKKNYFKEKELKYG